MSFCQFREIRLRDFRCFHERQTARLAPLTLLVGENSTGKTSFLAAVQAVWDAAYGSGAPDFRKAPFDLGAFPEIVHRRGGRANSANSFVIGFTELGSEERLLDFEVTFESRDAAPAPVATAWRDEAVSVEYRQSDGRNARMVCESPNGVWECSVPDGHRPFAEHLGRGALSALQVAEPKPDPVGYTGGLRALPEGSRRKPSPQELATFSFLSRQFVRVPSQEPPFASAPNHPSPQRTYDPMKLSSDPWGADVPSRFASLQFRDKAEWAALKAKLDAFGRESGLFVRLHGEAAHRGRGEGRSSSRCGSSASVEGRGPRGISRTWDSGSAKCCRYLRHCFVRADLRYFFCNNPSCICIRAHRRRWGASSAGRRKRGGSSS